MKKEIEIKYCLEAYGVLKNGEWGTNPGYITEVDTWEEAVALVREFQADWKKLDSYPGYVESVKRFVDGTIDTWDLEIFITPDSDEYGEPDYENGRSLLVHYWKEEEKFKWFVSLGLATPDDEEDEPLLDSPMFDEESEAMDWWRSLKNVERVNATLVKTNKNGDYLDVLALW